MARNSEAVSPTAYFTGYVWARHGLSHPGFATREGRILYYGLRPVMLLTGLLRGGSTLEEYLLARHRLIDRRLSDAIESGRVSQVIEIASGLSPRGWRFAQRWGSRITYVEADLPHMAKRKRDLLWQHGLGSPNHRVEDFDALHADGPGSLAALAKGLDPSRGLAIISEGLLNYLDRDAVVALWQRIAGALSSVADGVYLSDLHLAAENRGYSSAAFSRILSTFVRGQVHLHFEDVAEASQALRRAGFRAAELLRPPESAGRGGQHVRIIEAQAGRGRVAEPAPAARLQAAS